MVKPFFLEKEKRPCILCHEKRVICNEFFLEYFPVLCVVFFGPSADFISKGFFPHRFRQKFPRECYFFLPFLNERNEPLGRLRKAAPQTNSDLPPGLPKPRNFLSEGERVSIRMKTKEEEPPPPLREEHQ